MEISINIYIYVYFMEKKVRDVLNYYEILVFDNKYPYFSFFSCNTFFHRCKWFTATFSWHQLVIINKCKLPLQLWVSKCEWCLLLHNSQNVFLIFYVQWLLLSTRRQIFIWKNVFSKLIKQPFCIFWEAFVLLWM